MKIFKKLVFSFVALSSISLMLISCAGENDPSSGSISISVTDAPVDTAEKVVVEFSGVEIKPVGGEVIGFDFTDKCIPDPTLCQIDLLALTDGISAFLLDGEDVPSGDYSSMRFLVNAEKDVRDSYIVVGGKEFELRIPSGAQSGLKLNRGFAVPAGGAASFTIDFDLRKSVHNPVGLDGYLLRPTLRLVDNSEIGTLSGNVDSSFFAGGTCSGAVYVFFDGTVDAPDDEDGEGLGPDPITSAFVEADGVYSYKIGFLAEGDYLVAFTCDASADDPATDDDSLTVDFLSTAVVTVTSNSNVVHDFEATATP